MKGKIVGVSLGPGEPELITLKALKALQGADIIYCPGTQTKSRSRDILQALPVAMERIRLFHVPMSKDRTFANQAYDALCTEIASLVATGKNVAITAEGDSGFYSSVNYMFDRLASMNLPVTTVAGVPLLLPAGAHLGPSHCETRRKTRRPTGNNHRQRTGHPSFQRSCCGDHETLAMHGRNTPFHAKKSLLRVPLLRKCRHVRRATHDCLQRHHTQRLPLFLVNDYSSLQTIGIDIAYKKTQDE